MLGFIALGILVTLLASWGIHKHTKLEGMYGNQQELYKETLIKLLAAEREKAILQATLDNQQQGIIMMLKRESDRNNV